MLDDVVNDAIHSLDIPPEIVAVVSQGALPLVLADPVQLSCVFVNLLNNAFEALGDQATPQITVSLAHNPEDDLVEASVTDNGSGIDPEDLGKIWITFHTTKGLKGHPGLGLPACRLIMEQTGGSMAVSSTLGQGSTFTVGVPVYQQADKVRQEPRGKGKILLVDDDDTWRHFAGTTLSKAGYNVSVSGDNYTIDPPAQFHLILVDDILAGADSGDVLAVIKQAGVIDRVVAVSSNPRVERTKERMLLGIKNLLPKPYIASSLLAEVRAVLS
jgi:CheY-like chemotaxis protein